MQGQRKKFARKGAKAQRRTVLSRQADVFLQILNVIKTYHLSVFSLRLCAFACKFFSLTLHQKAQGRKEEPFYNGK